MTARSVQISMDERLLARVDGQPEVRRHGRSAFIRAALEAYLDAGQRSAIDREYARAYGGTKAKRLHAELEPLIGSQAWPEE